jgi:hypothetical protein
VSTTRPVSPGKSRKCPHCRSDILESASVCPACRHHLRFGQAAEQAGTRFSALHVEGTIRHPAGAGAWEYSVVIAIRNQKGEEIARQIIGIGAMQGADLRSFDLSVDVFAPEMNSAASNTAKPLASSTPTASVSPPPSLPPKQPATVAPTKSIPPVPRQTSTVSPSRSVSGAASRSPVNPPNKTPTGTSAGSLTPTPPKDPPRR